MTIFASGVSHWPRSQLGNWEMNGTPIHGGQEDTTHMPTDRVELYVGAVCSFGCTIAHDRHIQFFTVLPLTNFRTHSVSHTHTD